MIEKIMTYLNDSGYNAHLEQPSETFNFSEIWVNLTGNLILKVHSKAETIPTEDSLIQGSEMHFIHFFMAFDKVIEEKMFADAARLCAMLNKVIPIGAFGFSEPDCLFTFSYIYPTSKIDAAALDTIFSLIHFTVELHSPTLLDFKGLKSLLG